jgi:hypothetical protein
MSIENHLDRLKAKAKFEWGSAVCVQFPNTIGKRLVGENPVRWYLARTLASEIEWQKDPGYSASGPTPALYRAFMIAYTNGPLLDQLARDLNGQPAAAFRAIPGKEPVAVTTLPFGEWAGLPSGQGEAERQSQRQVMFGLGQTALDATVGVYFPNERAFRAAPDVGRIIETDISIADALAKYPQAIKV